MSRYILWFNQLGIKDVPIAGGKNASLGEMYRKLTSKGVKVPNGYAITAGAYRYLLKDAGIEQEIKDILFTKSAERIDDYRQVAASRLFDTSSEESEEE